MTPSPIKIYNNGIYYPPQEVVTNGYWGKFGKVANELPLDYEENKKKSSIHNLPFTFSTKHLSPSSFLIFPSNHLLWF
jgi:hypothetical protein